MKKTARYEWENALIDAQVAGHICNGALLLALKLSRAIHWAPKNGKPAGLYWKNDEALKSVGAGRSTYFKHRAELFGAGFLCEEKGNLVPCIPQSTVETIGSSSQSTGGTTESTVETNQSTVETLESTGGTGKSTGEHPLSVDTLSVDVVSEEHTPAAPVANEVVVLSPTTLSSQTERSDGSTDEEFRESTVWTEPVEEISSHERARLKALALHEKRKQRPVEPTKTKTYVKEEFASW